MNVLWVSGNHPRHLYCLNNIKKEFAVTGALIECREHMIPEPPAGLQEIDVNNFQRHFHDRHTTELKFFGTQKMPDCETLEVDQEGLNTNASAAFVKKINADVAIVFGVHLIKSPLMEALPEYTINLHMGLSPRYRGAATLFWPFYFLEPCYAGSTIHYLVAEPDAGRIVHQVVPELHPDDGIHDVACKTVVNTSMDVLKLLDIFEKNKDWNATLQKSTGKNFLGNDFKPEHLRMIYNVYDNDMVRHYLDGTLKSKTPKLVCQF